MNTSKKLKVFLDAKADFYNKPSFIDSDPISIPHSYSTKEDVEISGFFSAVIAWGNRASIIKDAKKICELMDNSPYDFVMNHQEDDLKRFQGSMHRTFLDVDIQYFIFALNKLYSDYDGLEGVFSDACREEDRDIGNAIVHFNKVFFQWEHLKRSEKHISNPMKGSAAKRICMYLRWMVRNDKAGVDFGLWKSIPMSKLCIPLDVHSGRVGRELGLLNRKQNDWKAVVELTGNLRNYNPEDPAKYDFALFGIGVSE